MSFGPFSLAPRQRLLTREGKTVELGARAIDILIMLVSRANEVVSKRDLLAQVWPDTIVDEGSLRFHVSSLRKALGDGKDGARYIATAAGRGYCFVAPPSPAQPPKREQRREERALPQSNLPRRLARMVGRGEERRAVSSQLLSDRLLTIVGPGGMGKTVLAVAVGHDLAEAFEDSVLFVDLGTLADPPLVTSTVASLLGLSVPSDDATPSLVAHLRDRRILLIFDTCEHVIEAVAALTASLLSGTSRVHVLATSREALRIEGEHVFPLDGLASPVDASCLSAAQALPYPAVQLFLERAEAGGARIEPSDANIALVAQLCGRLDGVALAIELAAGRVGAHGLKQIARLLDEHLALFWPGQRTAPPRQRTLQATLEWSYGLLSESERTVLRGLAIFVGDFTIEDATEILNGPNLDRATVLTTLDGLVAKSVVSIRPADALMRYRLLDATRAYLLRLHLDHQERSGLAARHAGHYAAWLNRVGTRWPSLSDPADRATVLAGLDNARVALEWAFGTEGNTETGAQLAIAAGPVLLSMSLLPEGQRWSERALAALDPADLGGLGEMHLQAAVGISLMFMRGGHEAALAALERSVAIAEQHGDARAQLRLLGPVNMFHLRTGNFKEALRCAERSRSMIQSVREPVASTLAHSILGMSLHLSGDLEAARAELEIALADRRGHDWRSTTGDLGFESRSLAGVVLARCLWLQGHPDQAVQLAHMTVREAELIDHPLSLSIALIWATTVFLWTRDLAAAERYIVQLGSCAEANALAPYRVVARAFEGELAIRQGDAKTGTEVLRICIQDLHAAPYELVTTTLKIAFAQGLAALDRTAEAMAAIEEAIGSVGANGDTCYLPELLRLKAQILLLHADDRRGARSCLVRSLRESRRQGALGWELRIATDLAHLLVQEGLPDRARNLLQRAVSRFDEGEGTLDMRAAKESLAAIHSQLSIYARR